MRVATAAALGLVLCLGSTGCQGDGDTAAAADSSAGCPKNVTAMLDPAAKPKTDLRLLIDPTGSFDRSGPDFRAQFTHVAETAVSERARLTVAVLGGSASGVELVLSCPAVVPLVRNDQAAKQLTARLTDRLDDALWNGYQRADSWDKKGSDIVGGFRSVADTPPTEGTRLVVIAWTDGVQNIDARGVDVALPQATVLMYGIGHTAGSPLPTTRAEKLVQQWTDRLRATGADQVHVHIDLYSGGVV